MARGLFWVGDDDVRSTLAENAVFNIFAILEVKIRNSVWQWSNALNAGLVYPAKRGIARIAAKLYANQNEVSVVN